MNLQPYDPTPLLLGWNRRRIAHLLAAVLLLVAIAGAAYILNQ